jgi:ribonuclease HI
MYKRIPKIISMSKYIMKFDGCSKGNPGHSGAGAVIYKDEVEIWSDSKYIGNYKTNNEAEYSALILGLYQARNLSIDELLVCGDSQMVIRQMNAEYKVKSPKLVPLYTEAAYISKDIKQIKFEHIYREQNQRADQLANLSIINLFKHEILRTRN